VRLPDGRRIEYREFGDPSGVPAMYLHGTPSSGSEGQWLDRPTRAHGVRLVSIDRPGYLRSEAGPDRSFTSVARDIGAAAEALELSRFAVVGFSSGGGYAVATAHVLPDRVTVVHLGGAMGSTGDAASYGISWGRRLLFGVVGRAPALSAPLLAGMLRLNTWELRRWLEFPDGAALALFRGPARGAQVAAVADYVRSRTPDELRIEMSDYLAGTGATQAVVDDVLAMGRPWQFDLSAIAAPVELWQGRDDPAVPTAYAEGLASDLPNARLHLFDGEGHFVFHTHGDAIAASIREHATEPAMPHPAGSQSQPAA
jgi:pimeloyl-ACP methyl ester carboxylesterase